MKRRGANRSTVERKRPGRGVKADKPVAAGAESPAPPGWNPGPAGVPPGPPLDPDGVLVLDPEGSSRPVDARWRLAARVAAGDWVPDDWVDPWVRLAVRFLTAGPDEAADPELAAVGAARGVAARDPGDWARVAVEGRLLIPQPHGVVAEKEGLTAEAVGAYAALFYDVAGRLPARGLMAHTVLGLHSARADTDPAVHVRAYAYNGGAVAFEAALDAFAGAEPDDRLPAARREVRQGFRALIAIRMTPVTPETAPLFLRLHQLHLMTRGARR